MRNVFCSLFAILLLVCWCGDVRAHSKNPADAVSGVWYTENREGGIQLYPCDGDKVCGRFYWFSDDGNTNEPRDDQNPDPQKRGRGLCHLQFMGDFAPDGQGHYAGGWIYSPRHGQIFSAEMTLVDANTLKLRGYILSPVLGKTQIWKRIRGLHSCTSRS